MLSRLWRSALAIAALAGMAALACGFAGVGWQLTVRAGAVVFGCLMAAGTVLLVLGFRGRRVGDAPHCRRCEYNLTGVAGERCPECGVALTPRAIVAGRRERRRRPLIVGTACMALAAIGLGLLAYGEAKKIDWYQHYTVGSLTGLAKSDDARALKELLRRAQAGLISSQQLPGVVEAALAKHGVPTAPPNVLLWADLLAMYDNVNALSADQRDRFYRRLAPVQLAARSRIRVGDEFLAQLAVEDRMPPRMTSNLLMQFGWARLGDAASAPLRHPPHWENPEVGGTGGVAMRYLNHLTPKSPGRHELEWTVTYGLFALGAQPNRDKPLWTATTTESVTITVLPHDAPDPIELRSDEQLATRLRRLIRIHVIWVEFGFLSADASLSGEYLVNALGPRSSSIDRVNLNLSLDGPVPVCLAFDVFAVVDGREIDLGDVVWQKGESGIELPSRPHQATWPAAELDTVTIRLRTSRAAAAGALDCYEVWDGELELGPVAVSSSPFAPSTQPAPATSPSSDAPKE